ncbi:hypothetical protein QQS21_004443 [Conoideocrella luteorostrata]|uniref:Armadillo-type protein n=1 Tax=Conoideocrella luteorostrata TaxID=1105319 RepID=A0AAJ0CRE0_9HYPO|nr:hypothetical protein QQS21_004443 [Conoideocrella luteorostrata]
MTPQEVAALLHEHGSSHVSKASIDSLESNDAQQERTELLASVLTSCRDLWSTKSEDLDLIAEKLGDGSRDLAWRLPYGDSGILEFFISLLAEGDLRQKLHVHALRLIGNSCADTDKNRARLVEDDRLLSITKHVPNESLIPFNVPVIYNVLVDYEPAQSLASRSGLSRQLVGLLSLPSISKYAAFVPYICKTLGLLVSQEGEAAVADPATVSVLLQLANQPAAKEDVEDFITVLGVAVAYLASEDFQSRLISDNQVPLFMDAFYHIHVQFGPKLEDEDAIAQLKQLRTSLLSTFADISGNDIFPRTYPLSETVPQSLLAWMRINNSSLRAAACLALGNISRSDEASVALVETYQAHEPLTKLLSDPAVTDTQFLHAACSFLKNLAIPTGNKPQLKDLLEPRCIPRLYSLDTLPQIQFAAVSLTRLLLLSCPLNVQQVCASPVDANSPAVQSQPSGQQTTANGIISLFGRTDAEPTRLEAARCVASICRVLHAAPASETLPKAYVSATAIASLPDDEKSRSNFYAEHSVEKPLRFLIMQDKWPALRSEAWFVFALMSRSKDGAGVVLSVLDDKAAEAILTETITWRKLKKEGIAATNEQHMVSDSTEELTTGTSSLQLEPQQVNPQQKASMAKVDAENALILCTELVKMVAHELAPEKLAMLQALVRDGTQRVVTDRA